MACYHCGERCPDQAWTKGERLFCCQGCLVVHELLAENGLDQFYDLSAHPGVKVRSTARRDQWQFLDQEEVSRKLLDYSDGNLCRVSFHVPSIHCIACVWLLENLYRLHPGIGRSQVNFLRREVSIVFYPAQVALSEVVTLLAGLGYEPSLTLGSLDRPAGDRMRKRHWLQVGIAGFAFGNIMLFSVPAYLGLDSLNGPLFQAWFGGLSLVLALPVLIYSAADYWKSAGSSLRQRVLTLDVPIALGLAALYGQSAFEILSGRGEGYLDSMAGLVFLLLCGRAFQQKTHERILFDRDYRSFFPLSVLRRGAAGEETVALSALAVGDRLVLRQGELIPADSRLVSGSGCVDYSFVTGESEPVMRHPGDYLYAGGQQIGEAIEVEMVKPVSQGYLTSLWSHEAFRKNRETTLDTLTNRYSRRFTVIVIAVALASVLGWVCAGDTARGLKAFASVLIVACPCALALAAPFALGTAQRVLARLAIFLKNGHVLERLAEADTLVFDKTGTLTSARDQSVTFIPAPGEPALAPAEETLVFSLCRQSTHPASSRIADVLAARHVAGQVRNFVELAGQGIRAEINSHPVWLGSGVWLERSGWTLPAMDLPAGSASHLVINDKVRGVFVSRNRVRPRTADLFRELGNNYQLALLSGDNARERGTFQELFGPGAGLLFDQGPLDKLGYIRTLQAQGGKVVMLGDGLNDAGALRQSDVGIAVVEKPGAFSPASDIILPAGAVADLPKLLDFSRRVTRVVRICFGISAAYNLAGVSIAAAGILSPLICAVLMPISSVTVVLFACAATQRMAARAGLWSSIPDAGRRS